MDFFYTQQSIPSANRVEYKIYIDIPKKGFSNTFKR